MAREFVWVGGRARAAPAAAAAAGAAGTSRALASGVLLNMKMNVKGRSGVAGRQAVGKSGARVIGGKGDLRVRSAAVAVA